MTQVKLFSEDSYTRLESIINKWILENGRNFSVEDIKFTKN